MDLAVNSNSPIYYYLMGGAVLWMVAFSLLRVEAKEVEIVKFDTSRVWLLNGDVTITTENVNILAPRGIYYEDKEMGFLMDTVVFSTDSTLIVSDTLWYQEEGRFRFVNFASVTQPGRFLGSHSMEVVGDSVYLSGPLFVSLYKNGAAFCGDTGIFDLKEHRGKIWENAGATLQRAESLHVNADTFYFFGDTLWAIGDVNVNTSKFEARGDTFFLLPGEREYGVIWGSTHIKSKSELIDALSLSFYVEKGKISLLTASGDVTIESKSEEGMTVLKSGYAEFSIGQEGELESLSAFSGVSGNYVKKGSEESDVGPEG